MVLLTLCTAHVLRGVVFLSRVNWNDSKRDIDERFNAIGNALKAAWV